MTSVFFTLPITKFYLIAFTSSTLFLCPVCICWMGVDTGQGTASWCRESVRVGSSHSQQCSMFYNTPCVQHSWAVMFSVTQGELFPMAMDETYRSCVDIILSVVHFWTCCEQQQIYILLSFMYAGRVQLSPLFCMPNVFHQRQLEMNTPQVAWRVSKW